MSSVLETFLIQFATNGDEAVKDTKKVDDALNGLARSAAGMVAGFLSIGTLINGIFTASKMANDLGELSELIGISVEDLSVWGDAVAASGGTAAGFQGSIQGMTDDFVQLATLGKSRLQPFFKALGIDIKDTNGKVRNVMDVLPELADAFAGMGKQEALGFGRRLGLDTGTIRLLQQGRRELDAVILRQKELGVVTAKQVEIAKANDDAIDDLSIAYRSFSLAMAEIVLPPLTWFLEKLTKVISFTTKHKDAFIMFFTGVAAAALYLGRSMLMLGLSSAVALAPFLALLAGIGLLVLVVDDIMKFIQGGDSLIGKMLNWANQFKAFRVVVDFLTKSLKGLGMIWDAIKGTFKEIAGMAGQGFNIQQGAVAGLGAAQGAIQLATTTPLGAVTGNAARAMAGNRNFNMPIQNLTVNTKATDAEGIGNSISGALNAQMKQATADFDDGVAT